MFGLLLASPLPGATSVPFLAFLILSRFFPSHSPLRFIQGYSVYETLPWIVRLIEFIRHVLLSQSRVRVIGSCFGHQVVAAALGAPVARSPLGWEISVCELDLTDMGKELMEGKDRLVSTVRPQFLFTPTLSVSHSPYQYESPIFSLSLPPHYPDILVISYPLISSKKKEGITTYLNETQ